jgi:RNA polymerase sigma-70 factor (ECF subfamily)
LSNFVLPHVDTAFNLARWLLRGRTDPEDVAQEAVLRACRFFRSFHGGNARAWLLQIVRNTGEESALELSMEFDEELNLQTRATPEILAIAGDDRKRLIRSCRACGDERAGNVFGRHESECTKVH